MAGDNYPSIKSLLPEDVTRKKLKLGDHWVFMSDLMFEGLIRGKSFQANIGCYTGNSIHPMRANKIAGHNVYSIGLRFVFTTDDNGKLATDEMHTALIYAQYEFLPNDPDSVYADLFAELTLLYGDIDVEQKSTPDRSFEQCMWYGADDTMASVVREDYEPSGKRNIYIKYGFKYGDVLMEQALAAVKEENENAASNTDGL